MIDDFLPFLEEWLGLHLTEEFYVLDLLSFVSATAVQSSQILPAKPVWLAMKSTSKAPINSEWPIGWPYAQQHLLTGLSPRVSQVTSTQ